MKNYSRNCKSIFDESRQLIFRSRLNEVFRFDCDLFKNKTLGMRRRGVSNLVWYWFQERLVNRVKNSIIRLRHWVRKIRYQEVTRLCTIRLTTIIWNWFQLSGKTWHYFKVSGPLCRLFFFQAIWSRILCYFYFAALINSRWIWRALSGHDADWSWSDWIHAIFVNHHWKFRSSNSFNLMNRRYWTTA